MNSVPFTGSPPMPTQVDWPSPVAGGLRYRLVGQRARTRDDADRAGLVDVPRHDPDLALVRRDHARAVRSDQACFGAVQRALDRTMSSTGMPSVIATTRGLRVDRLQDRVCGEGGGT